jgi:hypothetical protein
MGDNVKMRDTDLTRALGIAGKSGSIFLYLRREQTFFERG